MNEALLFFISVQLAFTTYMGRQYFKRAEEHFKDIHKLINAVNVHEFAIGRLWEKTFAEQYPYSTAKEVRKEV